MRRMISDMRQNIERFNRDEDGMEAMQVVMIVAIAAMVLIALKVFWKTIWSWADGLVSKVTQGGGN